MWELKEVDLIEVERIVIIRSWSRLEEVVGKERIVNQQGGTVG